MKRIYHESQLATKRLPLATNDMIVFGRNAYGDDVELARVGGHCGNRSHGQLIFEPLHDLSVRRLLAIGNESGITGVDWSLVEEQQESIADANRADCGVM